MCIYELVSFIKFIKIENMKKLQYYISMNKKLLIYFCSIFFLLCLGYFYVDSYSIIFFFMLGVYIFE